MKEEILTRAGEVLGVMRVLYLTVVVKMELSMKVQPFIYQSNCVPVLGRISFQSLSNWISLLCGLHLATVRGAGIWQDLLWTSERNLSPVV